LITSEYCKFEKYKAIIGVDEAGRGPIAGPVVAAAVILPATKNIEGLNDSKKLTKNKREKLFEEIKKSALSYSINSVGPTTIDRINILEATFQAMFNAIKGLKYKGDYILVDGSFLPSKSPKIELNLPARPVVKGDEKYFCIAAASVLAKVYRDNLMLKYARRYPGYKLASNKGYPTLQHKKAIKKLGPCKIHRQTFKPIRNLS